MSEEKQAQEVQKTIEEKQSLLTQLEEAQKAIEIQNLRDAMLTISEDYQICPACGEGIEVVAKNCRIFICGTTEQNQLAPHDEKQAEEARKQGKIRLGCGKQFELVDNRLVPCTGK